MINLKKPLLLTFSASCVLLVSLSAAGQSREFNGGNHFACMSPDLFDQFSTAVAQNDARAVNYLMQNGCISPRGGIPVSVLDVPWSGGVHVRAYLDDTSMELWTSPEAISKIEN